MTPKETKLAQRIVDLAAKKSRGVTFSQRRRMMHVKLSPTATLTAELYQDGNELWVNFNHLLMSGNDPIEEFEITLNEFLENAR